MQGLTGNVLGGITGQKGHRSGHIVDYPRSVKYIHGASRAPVRLWVWKTCRINQDKMLLSLIHI